MIIDFRNLATKLKLAEAKESDEEQLQRDWEPMKGRRWLLATPKERRARRHFIHGCYCERLEEYEMPCGFCEIKNEGEGA